jgi:hypothetical protein
VSRRRVRPDLERELLPGQDRHAREVHLELHDDAEAQGQDRDAQARARARERRRGAAAAPRTRG